MPKLDSSAISKVTYNKKTKKMNVRFVGTGKSYTYVGVPKQVYQDFIDAPSAGQFFNDYIKDDYIATPSEFVDSVRFNEQMMKLGAMTLSEQQSGPPLARPLDVPPHVNLNLTPVEKDLGPLMSPPIGVVKDGEFYTGNWSVRSQPDPSPSEKGTIGPPSDGSQYFSPEKIKLPVQRDPYASRESLRNLYPYINLPDDPPIPVKRPTTGIPPQITESPVALALAGMKGLKGLVDKAGPLRPYNYDYYQAIKRKNANRLNRGQY